MGILIAYLLGVLSSVGRKNSNSHNIHTHADGGNRQTLPDGPISVVCVPPAKTDEERAKQKKSNRRKAIKFWAEIVGLIVLAIYTAFTGVTYWQIKKSAKEATEQFRADQRAWIAISVTSDRPKPGKFFPIKMEIKNTGKTSAENGQMCVVMEDGDIDPYRDITDKDLCFLFGLMPPVGVGGGTIYMFNKTMKSKLSPLTAEDVAELESGKATVRIRGKLTYSDVFGCKHWLEFCYNRIVSINNEVDWLGCEKWNAIDDYPSCTR